MMRLRRTSTIAALCVLASAATASAECGWVFWQDWDGSWMTTGTFETLAECKTRIRGEIAIQKLEPTTMVTEDSVTLRVRGKLYSRRYHCLPGTIDPRGPKTK